MITQEQIRQSVVARMSEKPATYEFLFFDARTKEKLGSIFSPTVSSAEAMAAERWPDADPTWSVMLRVPRG